VSVGPSLRAHLVRGVFGTLGLTVLTAGLTFVNGVLLARLLGAQNYGIYAAATGIVLLVTLPLALGFDRLIVRNVAASASAESWSLARGLIVRAVELVVPVTIGAIVIIGLAAVALQGSFAPGTVPVLLIALLTIPPTVLIIVRRALTLGLKRIVSSQLPENLVRPGMFTALLAIAYVTAGKLAATTAMALNLAAITVALVVGLYLLWRQAPRELRSAEPHFETRNWLREAAPFALAAAAQTLMTQVDVVLVGGLAGATPAGLYAVAARGAGLTLFGAAAVGTTLAPTAAQLWANNEHARLQRLVTRAARGAFLFALGVAIVMWLFGPQFLLLFGDEFVGANPTLAVLSFSSVIDCGFGIAGMMLFMTGYQALSFASIAVAVAVRIVVDIALIPPVGALGAAFGAVASIVVVNVMTTYFAARRLGIDSTPLGVLRVRSPAS